MKKRLVLIVQEAEGYPGEERAVVLGEGPSFLKSSLGIHALVPCEQLPLGLPAHLGTSVAERGAEGLKADL